MDRGGKNIAKGGGGMVYGSHGSAYAPGEKAVVFNYHRRGVLYYHRFNTAVVPLYHDKPMSLEGEPLEYVKGRPVLLVYGES